MVKPTDINEPEDSEDAAPKMTRIIQNLECSQMIGIWGIKSNGYELTVSASLAFSLRELRKM